MSIRTPEDQKLFELIDEHSKQIYSRVNELIDNAFKTQNDELNKIMQTAIHEIHKVSTQIDDKDFRKQWIRTFAAQIITNDTVDNAVKYSHALWDALEVSFNKESVIH